MTNFHTMYDPAEIKNKNKVYDTHDNVDRVSYVDSTRLVERFIAEGQSLNIARAKALRSGLYSGDMNEIINDDSPVIPVYKTDPAVLQPVIDDAIARQKARHASVATDANDKSNDDGTRATSDVRKPSLDVTES